MKDLTNNTKLQGLKRARFNRIFVVFAKEMRETLRDKRVLWAVFISPLLFTPAILAFTGFFIGQKVSEVRQEPLNVAVIGADRAKGLSEALQANKTLIVSNLSSVPEAERLIKDRSLRAVLVVPADASAKLAANEPIEMEILYDNANEKSGIAQERLEKGLDKFNEQVVAERLRAHGLNTSLLNPAKAKTRSLASDTSTGGMFLGIMLPYLIILGGAFSGMTSAFDIVAGEKERGTMETLLVSPASRTEIILGKLLTIFCVSTISAFCSIAGIVFSFQSGLKYFDAFTKGKIAISYPAVGVMLIMVLPLTFLTSAILLVISSLARNQKEAQAYAIPFMVVVMMPAMLSFILGQESPIGLSVIPILNVAMVMKQVLTSINNYPFMGLALGSSILYAGLAVVVVVALFNREEILFRS